jgi:hypothetical protein
MNSEVGMNCTLTLTFIKDNQLSLVVIAQIASFALLFSRNYRNIIPDSY